MQNQHATDTGAPAPSRSQPKPTRPPMLRRALVIVVIAIVAWMALSIGLNRSFRGFWKRSSASAGQTSPSGANSANGSPAPVVPVAVPPASNR